MALTAYARFRFLWGAVDWQGGSNNPYTGAQTGTNLGTSAAAGVATRRVQIVIDRTTQHAGADPAVMHFDFLNITGGAPDDTWTSGDFSTLETALDTWWTSTKVFVSTGYKLAAYNWYRVGPGIVPPNPAVRQTTRSVAGTAAYALLPPQVACSITFRTAVRRSWGRTYLPLGAVAAAGDIATGAVLASSDVDALATYTNTLFTTAAANDFIPVVYSPHRSALLAIEQVEVDNDLDVIRRRRWKASTYKKLLP